VAIAHLVLSVLNNPAVDFDVSESETLQSLLMALRDQDPQLHLPAICT
jgi:hypothetical protein